MAAMLENWYDIIILSLIIYFTGRCRITYWWRWRGQNQNRELNFNTADDCFQQPEAVISQPWI